MVGGENFHLVIADHQCDVGLGCNEDVAELSNGILTSPVALLKYLGSQLIGQFSRLLQLHHLVER